jgi:uncharacterized repeat protein (TIGR03803 family)
VARIEKGTVGRAFDGTHVLDNLGLPRAELIGFIAISIVGGLPLSNLKGLTVACDLWLLITVLAVSASAQTFKTLIKFNGSNGAFPSSIVQGVDGKLWGTTTGMGHDGTAFNMTTAGAFSKAFVFHCNKHDESDGCSPARMIQGLDGDLYGATFFGGLNRGGTIFKLTRNGVLNVLYQFTLDGSSGSEPVGLVQGWDGNFYGATYGGGSSLSYGTIFKITPSGKLTTLHVFDFTYGAQPGAGPIQGSDGNFYGTTYSGGDYGSGIIYRVTPKGVFNVLHSFGQNSSDGAYPLTPLIEGSDGDLYGVTTYGGSATDGIVFKIKLNGDFTDLHDFAEPDGREPTALVAAKNGNFYGTTAYGGTNDADGTLFEMTPSGTVTILHNFDGTDGFGPILAVQDTNGTLFGMTTGGGNLNCDPGFGCGTIYSLSVGSRPFVVAQPTGGKFGANVVILGTNLKGATSVTFNGTAAKFKVISQSEIKTTVPAGATAGKVRVKTPLGTLVSNMNFRVFQ